ncbi:MAG: uncharacterized protein QOE83_2604 [Actinomycetota bacterium]|nr:uncharacterized protein [Actinomycetota bacterium]
MAEKLPDPFLYVHLLDDGGIFVVDGCGPGDKPGRGLDQRVTMALLMALLDDAWETDAQVMLSLDDRDLLAQLVASSGARLSDESFLSLIPTPVRAPLKAVMTSRRVKAAEAHLRVRQGLDGGATSMMAAAYGGVTEAVVDLIERGAVIDATDQVGYTALMFAAAAGQSGVIKTLIERGANVDVRGKAGETPLMLASQSGDQASASVLIDAGADVNARESHGLTAADFDPNRRST